MLSRTTVRLTRSSKTRVHRIDSLSRELLERARRVVPTLEGAKVEDVRVGVRPMPEDGLPCVGAVSELPGYYEAVTHSGVTLGPLLGRLLAREILGGEVDSLISLFRPARFARDQASP
ncbi:MAG: FAD-binding oxidoreductase [Rubrobacter sp.]|nr:FAD-binding oxidoreductase [Rubrobacter sp.]